jgi:hypothetical protein
MTLPSGAASARVGGAAAAAAALAAAQAVPPSRDTDGDAVVDDGPVGAADAAALLAAQASPAVAPNRATAASRAHEATDVHDPRREVSVEELIDLEQQADFFVVLGQDDAAVDLLMGHVQGTGGASPLPYLKLLEIHRRRDERGPYDKVRERFNRRFNAFAPEWDAHSGHDRSLEDYPAVIEHLQDLWREPTAAMDELAALLFQRDPTAQTFDLPAYGELLFLYSLAREVAEDPATSDGVDLLLPLDDLPLGSGKAAGGVAMAAVAASAARSADAAGAMSFTPLPGLDELPSIPNLPEEPGTYPAPLSEAQPKPRNLDSLEFDGGLLDLNINDDPAEPKGPLSKH